MPSSRLLSVFSANINSLLATTRALNFFFSPSRRTSNLTCSPTGSNPIWFLTSEAAFTGFEFIDVMISPGCRPASCAGESGNTLFTIAPFWFFIPNASARSAFKSCTWTPMKPRSTIPLSSSCSVICRARLIGIAKPIPILPPPRENIAVFMPTSSPFRLTSAPPEFPGLMEASV